jgi:miniconductance mechanosensitive channel
MDALRNWLIELGLKPEYAAVAGMLLAALVLLIVAGTAHFIAKHIIVRLVRTAARRTRTKWDDALVEAKVFSRIAHMVPALIVRATAPLVLSDYPEFASLVITGTFIYMVLAGIIVISAILDAGLEIYGTFELSRRVPLRVFVQVLKVIVFSLGGISVLAILLGKSPLVMVSGLGAFTAVLLLIFKDAILGLVAGIQLAGNNMVRAGDWISMPKHGADGDVLEVSLTTVKVQNWDKTITTIPTYALVSESFKNWRGMEESGGRRIKRSIYLDATSIKFCDREMIDRFKKIQFIADYVEQKLEEVSHYNEKTQADLSLLVNGRHLTNVGTFRAYLEAYLRNHPKIHKEMTFLVRQLQPTEHGLPIEIYVFSNDQAWARYEGIQSDIFDHILAVVPLFDLRVFQAPTGADLRELAGTVSPSSAVG